MAIAEAGPRQARTLAIWALAMGIAGCTAGPDFRRPDAPDVADYTPTPVARQTESAPTKLGEAQQFVIGMAMDIRWWGSLKSARLDALIEQALRASPTLAAAKATLRQAQEIYSTQAGATLYPQVEGGIGAQRQGLSPSVLGQTGDAREFSLYNASVGVHYNLDIAGGNRRALESLAARADRRGYELEAARLSLAGNIATAAITLALQTLAEQTRAQLPTLKKQMQQTEHLLAVLAGQAPGEGGIPDFTLTDFSLPAELPLVVPSDLVRRRPDIQAAEALLHAANADYGVAVAKLYPQLNLSASLGSQALTTGALFGGGSAVWSLVAQLTQPLFNPGLPAEKRAALAAFDAAAANYQGVVLEALRNVADALRAVENDAQALAALAAANEAAEGSLRSVERQYQLGAASYVQLLIAQQQAQQTRLGLAAAQAQRLTDSVALYQAVGAEAGSGVATSTLPGEAEPAG